MIDVHITAENPNRVNPDYLIPPPFAVPWEGLAARELLDILNWLALGNCPSLEVFLNRLNETGDNLTCWCNDERFVNSFEVSRSDDLVSVELIAGGLPLLLELSIDDANALSNALSNALAPQPIPSNRPEIQALSTPVKTA